MIKGKVWARLAPIWALVPLSHYIAWLVPLWVKTFLPSNTLAWPSLIVQNGRQNATERKSSKNSFYKILISHLKTTTFNVQRLHQWIQRPRKHRKRRITRQNLRFPLFIYQPPNRQWNVIKGEVWARLTPIWALVPLSHYIAWLVPLWVNTFLPSNTLARPSLIVQNGRQNATERKSSKDGFYKISISHLKTTTF